MKIGDKIRIVKVKQYKKEWEADGVFEGGVYKVITVGLHQFTFKKGIVCYLEDDEDFEYELVDEKEILKECKEFEEQLKKQEEIMIKAKEWAKQYMKELESMPVNTEEFAEIMVEENKKQTRKENKVWVVETVRDYEGSWIEKVFSTEEKALQWMNNDKNKNNDELHVSSYKVE